MNITSEQKLLAIAAHLSYLLCGLGFLLVPILIFLLKKEDCFVAEHAKQALAAHIVLLIIGSVTAIFSLLLIGILLWPVCIILGFGLVVTSLIASYKALNGEEYYYPLIQDLVRKL